MKKEIILIGAGGHCKACIDVIELENKFKIVGLIDNKKIFINRYKTIGSNKNLKRIKIKNALITIGQIKNLSTREKTFKLLKKLNFNLSSVISPLAYLSNDVTLGSGSIIMHKVIANKGAKVGKN